MSAPGTKPANEPVVIRLRSPIVFGSKRIEEITVRPVKAKHLRSYNSSDDAMKNTLVMASKLTGLLSEEIDELEGDDLREVLAAVNAFFLAIQGTGQSSSGS